MALAATTAITGDNIIVAGNSDVADITVAVMLNDSIRVNCISNGWWKELIRDFHASINGPSTVSVDAEGQGLKVGFYKKSCPQAEVIVSKVISNVMAVAPSLSGPLLRMHFHDCFIRGCDGSVLLDSPTNQSEKFSPPNLSLRGFNIIDRVKLALEKAYPDVVSCADIVALVARDVTVATKGPYWEVETGRRDGNVSLFFDPITPVTGLPSFTSNISVLKQSWALRGLSTKDLVVLSGGHTIGISHCSSFDSRLYNFTGKRDTDPTMDPNHAPSCFSCLLSFLLSWSSLAENPSAYFILLLAFFLNSHFLLSLGSNNHNRTFICQHHYEPLTPHQKPEYTTAENPPRLILFLCFFLSAESNSQQVACHNLLSFFFLLSSFFLSIFFLSFFLLSGGLDCSSNILVQPLQPSSSFILSPAAKGCTSSLATDSQT
ncbi:unnamed protein product [Lactuca virosa]|uniref:peroxidase n=1 Tax=Lactuca virosa TaxID=75947 RepID=A0AAU9NQR8_9ASTR|nr:unnamed protein product [Lactuca virosa]